MSLYVWCPSRGCAPASFRYSQEQTLTHDVFTHLRPSRVVRQRTFGDLRPRRGRRLGPRRVRSVLGTRQSVLPDFGRREGRHVLGHSEDGGRGVTLDGVVPQDYRRPRDTEKESSEFLFTPINKLSPREGERVLTHVLPFSDRQERVCVHR